VSTLSEAIQEKFNKKDCPFMHECNMPVTKDFFTRVCKTPAYVNCHYFAKLMNELQTPITWLQKLAVDQAKLMNTNMEATQP